VQYRLLVRQGKPDRRWQIVPLDLRLRVFQRPGNMMDIGANRLPGPIAGKQAIALGKEVL
jgi:hypothetical protein